MDMKTPDTEVCEICHGFGNNGADDAQCLNCGGSGKCDDTPDTEDRRCSYCKENKYTSCTVCEDAVEGSTTTPDTEWEEEFWNERIDEAETLAELFSGGDMYNLEFARSVINPKIQALLSSRDTYWKEQLQKAREEERGRIEAVFKEHVPPHAMDLEDSVWLKRLLNKAFQHES